MEWATIEVGETLTMDQSFISDVVVVFTRKNCWMNWPLKSMELEEIFFLVFFFFDFVRIWLIDEIRFSQSFRQWFCSKMPVLCSHAWEGTLAHCSKNQFFVQKFKLCKNLQKNYFDIFNSFCIKNDNFFFFRFFNVELRFIKIEFLDKK